ncbi:leukocyte immunoglobulin-like receptor subfamily B member 4 isoform X7 [Loxodonta africana]|uniref:leukocyte immunoglobulin-like receptor subfamily B member 4 isoform X7 n=1 Tax=Loxodonta africana TaxID=9785 RepID=UPI0030CB40EA
MSLTPTTFLGLVLCLGPEIQAHNGSLPRPSISAEPGSMIRWGMPVTFVCQSPHGAEAFRLEKSKSNSYQDVKLSSGTEKEARFLINSVTTDTAGRYNCLYFTGNTYSERSEFLELVVTGDHGSFSPSPTVLHSSPVEWQSSQPGETLLKVLALSHRAIKGKSLNSALEARSRMSEFNASLHHPLVDVCIYCYKLTSEHCLCCVPNDLIQLVPKSCHQNCFTVSLGSLWPFSFVSSFWSSSSSIVSVRENTGSPEARARSKIHRRG